ncbi:MAG: serine protease [Rhodomicrobiaceae bacterium]
MTSRFSKGCIAIVLSLLFITGAIAQEVIKSKSGKRIVGGETTEIEKHPWQVALNIDGSLCGGSIIGPKWVLTAAHCIPGNAHPKDVKYKAGATHLRSGDSWKNIEKIIVHKGYNPQTYENDIALIKLRRPPVGKIIPLAKKNLKIEIGQDLEVTGWGATGEGGDISDKLKRADVPFVSNQTCNAKEIYDGIIGPGMMCAGRKSGGVDACQGDSGGPLVLKDDNGDAVLVGVVSWGEGCARKLKYGVYTSVSIYRDWIKNTRRAN